MSPIYWIIIFIVLLIIEIATLGLTRNAAGGFGGTVPEPTQTSGGRHYGIG